MEAYDLAHKLAYAGVRSPVPFITGPQFTNGIPGVPVASMLRVFIRLEDWNKENILIVSKEICRVLGPREQFDVGLTLTSQNRFGPEVRVNGVTARLMKLDRTKPAVVLRMREGTIDQAYVASFPRLEFEPSGDDFWRTLVAPGLVKVSSQE